MKYTQRFFLFLTWLCGSNSVFAQAPQPPLVITPLTGDFFIFTTYNLYKGEPVPANGMYLVTDSGAVLFDTPWDTTQFQPLLDSIQLKHNKKPVICIATHSHKDKTAGLHFFRENGVRTFTTQQTDEISKRNGEKRAEFLLKKDSLFSVGQYRFQTYYPGAGHTPDNIVIWFEKEKVLYGGCLVKSVESRDLGYTGEAVLQEWPATIKKLQAKFPSPKFIIPGHQSWTSPGSLEHTLKLIRRHRKK